MEEYFKNISIYIGKSHTHVNLDPIVSQALLDQVAYTSLYLVVNGTQQQQIIALFVVNPMHQWCLRFCGRPYEYRRWNYSTVLWSKDDVDRLNTIGLNGSSAEWTVKKVVLQVSWYLWY